MVTWVFFNLTKFGTFYSHNSKFLASVYLVYLVFEGRLTFLHMLLWEHLFWMEYTPIQGNTCTATLILEFLQQKVIQWYFTDTLQIVLHQSPDGGVDWLRSALGCPDTVSTFFTLYSVPIPFRTSVSPLIKWRKQEDIITSWLNSLLKSMAETVYTQFISPGWYQNCSYAF